MIGRIHSIQSLGTIDGPGVRFVAFLQGCPLRCACCHNPDSWDTEAGTDYTPEEVMKKVLRCKGYFGSEGGITLSGGEPLLQAGFARELFTLCHQNGIHTCLDTSGCVWHGEVETLLSVTDRVLLDYKYPTEEAYRTYVGCSLDRVKHFLSELQARGIPTTLRQVTIPGLTDTPEVVSALKEVATRHSVVDKVELLPFRTICQPKYDAMGIPFPFGDKPTPTKEKMAELNAILA